MYGGLLLCSSNCKWKFLFKTLSGSVNNANIYKDTAKHGFNLVESYFKKIESTNVHTIHFKMKNRMSNKNQIKANEVNKIYDTNLWNYDKSMGSLEKTCKILQ